MGWSRRAMLRRALALGVAGGTAGCARTGLVSTPSPTPTGTFLDWIPAPDAVDGGRFVVRTLSRSQLRRHRTALHPATRKMLRRREVWRRFRPLSRAFPGADRLLRAGPGRVYLGLDTGRVSSYLLDRRYDRLDPHRGFELFRKSPLGFELYHHPEVVGVGDRAVVTSVGIEGGAVTPRRQVELVVDAKLGALGRFHEQSAAHGHVARVLPGATVGVAAEPGVDEPLGGVTVYGHRWTVGPELTRFRGALAFEDDDDAEVADLGGYAREVAPGHRDLSVDRAGATATLRAEIPTGQFDAGYPGDPGAGGIPDVTFRVEPLGDGERARVVHGGGEPVDAARLTVTVDGEAADRQFAGAHDAVRPGDAVTVATPGLAVVEVAWTAPGGAASLLLTKAAAR